MELLFALMRVLFPDFCQKCGAYGSILCESCAHDLPSHHDHLYTECMAALSYRDSVTRSIILSLKTRPNKSVARLLTSRIYDVALEHLSELARMKNFRNPIIIPIPGSPEKLQKYGFNHADILASVFAEHLSESNPSVLTDILHKRTTRTKQAKTKSKRDRFNNMSQAFYLTPDSAKLRNACVILIDDVITTGATLLTARQLLLEAGARQVVCVSVAH